MKKYTYRGTVFLDVKADLTAKTEDAEQEITKLVEKIEKLGCIVDFNCWEMEEKEGEYDEE